MKWTDLHDVQQNETRNAGHVKLKKAIKRPRLVSLSLAGGRGFQQIRPQNSEFNETRQLTGTEPWRGMTLRDALV